MISFKRFLTEDTRFKTFALTNRLGDDLESAQTQFFSEMWDNCSDMIKRGKLADSYIYRGGDFFDDIDAAIGDPTTKERRSANTHNYYTYIIDNSEEWKNYPPRSRSFICSTDRGTASNFGEPYLYFPVNGSKIAQCPENDLWGVFGGPGGDVFGGGSLEEFNDRLAELFRVISPEVRKHDSTLQVFLESLAAVDTEYKKQGHKAFIETLTDDEDHDSMYSQFISFIANGIKRTGSLRKALEDFFDPKLNGVALYATKNFTALNDKEVWTNGKCYILNPEFLDVANKFWFKRRSKGT
jgi:hypothetical protein